VTGRKPGSTAWQRARLDNLSTTDGGDGAGSLTCLHLTDGETELQALQDLDSRILTNGTPRIPLRGMPWSRCLRVDAWNIPIADNLIPDLPGIR
jgi:hypothetical protein